MCVDMLRLHVSAYTSVNSNWRSSDSCFIIIRSLLLKSVSSQYVKKRRTAATILVDRTLSALRDQYQKRTGIHILFICRFSPVMRQQPSAASLTERVCAVCAVSVFWASNRCVKPIGVKITLKTAIVALATHQSFCLLQSMWRHYIDLVFLQSRRQLFCFS